MKVRRVVTGQREDGKPVIASDTMVDGIEIALAPGAIFHTLWGSDQTPRVPNDGSQPLYHTWLAPAGGYRFELVTAPPDAPPPDMSGISPAEIQSMRAAGVAEAEAKFPGLMATMEPDRSGFHTTDTVDLVYVLSGEIVLDLGDGETVALKAGDSLVQNGARHVWRNPGSVPCTFLAVLIGAAREG